MRLTPRRSRRVFLTSGESGVGHAESLVRFLLRVSGPVYGSRTGFGTSQTGNGIRGGEGDLDGIGDAAWGGGGVGGGEEYLQIHPGHYHYQVPLPLGHQPDHQGLLEYLRPGTLV